VRRNPLADFENINRNGKIAMKLADGDLIVRVAICTGSDTVLLTTAMGRCIRFPVSDVRLFKGRDSTGVRGIKLDEGDAVISLAILHHVEATPEEREAYLKQALGVRRAQAGEPAEVAPEPEAEASNAVVELSPARYAELGASEQFVLTVSERGFGKRSSSHDYRISGRGGKGIVAMIVNERNGRLVASFPVDEFDQIMLVTDGGKLIRCPVDDVRIAARNTQGVRIFKTEESEKVVSVERISEDVAAAPADNGNGSDAGEGEARG
jgi:DNA gyrase subunit A